MYRYELDYDFDKFCSDSESENFHRSMGQKFNNDADRNTIDNIRKGSTIVEGSVSADNEAQATQIQQSLTNTSTLGSYKVLSSSAVVAYNDQAVTTNNGGTVEEYNRTGIVVGSVVGGILLVLTIATIVWCCRKKDAASYEEKDTHPVDGTANKSGEHPQGYPGTS